MNNFSRRGDELAEETINAGELNLEGDLDFTGTIFVNSMLDMYRDIEKSRCDCGGKFFPGGPVGLKAPDGIKPELKYELMILFCSKCGKELKRIFAVDTSSREFHEEERRAFAELPRWERHTQGNPIQMDDEE